LPPPVFVFNPGANATPKIGLALATAYDEEYAALAAVSLPNKRAYAARHGLALFVIGPAGIACDRPASWSKVLATAAALGMTVGVSTGGRTTDGGGRSAAALRADATPGHEWALYMDSDAIFANIDAALEDGEHLARAMNDPAVHMIIARDRPSGGRINNGVFLLRRSNWTEHFLGVVWNATQFLLDAPGQRNSRFGDQRAFEFAIEQAEAEAELSQSPGHPVAYVPQREINSFPSTYKSGDIIIHIAGCLAGARRSRPQCAAELGRWAAKGA